jgi:hypothetical protein
LKAKRDSTSPRDVNGDSCDLKRVAKKKRETFLQLSSYSVDLERTETSNLSLETQEWEKWKEKEEEKIYSF